MRKKSNVKLSLTTKISLAVFLLVSLFLLGEMLFSLIGGIFEESFMDLWLLWILALIGVMIFVGYYWFIFFVSRLIDGNGKKRTILHEVIVWALLVLPVLLYGFSNIEWIKDAMTYEYTLGDVTLTFPEEYGSSSVQKDSDGEPWIVSYIMNDEDDNQCIIDFTIVPFEKDEVFFEVFKDIYERDEPSKTVKVKESLLENVIINGKEWKYFSESVDGRKYSMYAVSISNNFYKLFIEDDMPNSSICDDKLQSILKSAKYSY